MLSPIDRFKLQALDEEKSRLVLDGAETPVILDGVTLEAQFKCEKGYLLLLTHDCPYEECLHVYRLAHDLSILDHRKLGAIYTPAILADVVITAPDSLEFSFFGGDLWRVTLLGRRTLFRRRLLHLRRKS